MEVGVGYKIVSETFQEDEKCGLQEIQYLQVVDPFYAIRKESKFKEFIKVGLMRLKESGIQDRENSRFYTKKPVCQAGTSKFVSVGIVDIKPAFLAFVYGMCLSGLVLVVERVCRFLVVRFGSR
jgi:ionotropic glutamate receptor